MRVWEDSSLSPETLTKKLLRIRIRDPVTFWPRDPGWVESQHPDPGSGMNNPDHISRALKPFFWVKILKFFDVDPGSGLETVRIRDPGWKKVGSGINITDPHHCKKLFKNSISDFAAWKADGAAERLPGILSPRPALRDGQGIRLLSHQEIHEGKGAMWWTGVRLLPHQEIHEGERTRGYSFLVFEV